MIVVDDDVGDRVFFYQHLTRQDLRVADGVYLRDEKYLSLRCAELRTFFFFFYRY